MKCNCTRTCQNEKCTCFKAGGRCNNSRCHAKNGNCLNNDACNDDHEDTSSSSDSDEEKVDAVSQKRSRK